jgi:double-stranded uracil-DNA glycosylase
VPSPEDLLAVAGRTIPDVLRPGLDVLFCGINPGLWSAWSGHHFARPGNRFWPALHRGGFTPRQFRPAEQEELLALRLGITNIVERGSARAAELTRAELRAGGAALVEKVTAYAPRWLAVLGVTAYRDAFGEPAASIGRQERTIGTTRVWVLPNPSGLNAAWGTPRLVEAFGELRRTAERGE